MFDVDEHPNLAAAVELACRNGIEVAVSNPCLELWFLLHFEESSAFLDRKEAQRRAQAYLRSGKLLTEAALEELAVRHDDAVGRAIKLDAKHRGDGSPDGANPSSNVWRLIDLIRGTRPTGCG